MERDGVPSAVFLLEMFLTKLSQILQITDEMVVIHAL